MADEKPPTRVTLVWEHDLVLGATTGGQQLRLDSEGADGPSPVQALACALGGCMAIDVVHILRKGRHDLRGLSLELTGHRAPQEPRRFTRIAMHFTINGQVAGEHVQRAIDLSREKYCSVWHSMRQDIDLQATFSVVESV